MPSVAIAAIVFACVFGSALLGMFVGALLPEHHLSAESKDVMKLAMGLIATMAALVLGLLTASAKSSFDVVDNEVQQSAANVVLLDRELAQYGPETKDTRDMVRRALVFRLAQTWPEDGSAARDLEAPGTTPTVEGVERNIRNLAPQNDAQRALQSRALQTAGELLRTRWLVFAQAGNPIPTVFLVVLVSWLSILFISFGLLAPRNATVIAALMVCALAVSGSILLILEMSQPLQGLIKVSSAPLRFALSHLGQ
jgi:hypothetical protein